MAKSGSSPTGASDIEYDLFAELHELLEGNEALEQYIEDAQEVGDQEVEQCFRTIHDQNRASVGKLRQLLAKRLAVQAA